MIQSLHNFSKSWLAKGFLIIVALSFGAFFGQSQFFSKHDPHAIVAEIGDEAIGRETLRMEIQKKLRDIQAQSGESLDPAQIAALNLPRIVLEGMIQDSLLSQEVERLHLMVTDAKVISTLQQIPAFHDERGDFNRKMFEIVLQNNGLTEKMFVDQIREDLLRDQLISAIKVGVQVPTLMADNLFAAEYQTRQASMATFKPENMPAPLPPEDSVLEAFYTAHKDMFVAPEIRTFTALFIHGQDIAKGITPTEDEITAEYEAKKAHYDNKPLAEVQDRVIHDLQIQMSADKVYELTQTLDDALAGGATLEELSTAHHLPFLKVESVDGTGTTSQGISSPAFTPYPTLKDALLGTAFSTEDGQDSNFIEGPDGLYYIVHVDEVKPSQAQTFTEAKARVLKTWQLDHQIQAAVSKAQALAQDINSGAQKPILETLPPLILAEGNTKVSEDIQQIIYTLTPGTAGLAPLPDGTAVVVLNHIIPPTEAIRREKFDAFKNDLQKKLATDIVNSYVDSLRIQFPVRINLESLKMATEG